MEVYVYLCVYVCVALVSVLVCMYVEACIYVCMIFKYMYVHVLFMSFATI
jgi:hypothetical protein